MRCDMNQAISLSILGEIISIRRRYPEYRTGAGFHSEVGQIHATQLGRIRAFVDAQRPVEFILPAFPSKSPNLNKVLGRFPDMAEKLSISFLNELCQRIQQLYPPGAKLTICSDGRVFGDLIRVADHDISSYQNALRQIISDLHADHLATYNLENFRQFSDRASTFDEMRQLLVDEYADPAEVIKQKLVSNQEGTLLYRAITRFMLEDGLTPNYHGSKAALQKDSKIRALGVIQRSWAWGTLLDTQFPDAIRLSIHPQPPASLKIGIHMMPTHDNWLTPWHGVAVNLGGHFMLMKRHEAELLGGRIVMRDRRPSHFEIERSQALGNDILPARSDNDFARPNVIYPLTASEVL
ncbi:L-tyrosine/L-tryptophan isonitrile synthase family protein [Paraburkholderia aspalathi]|uniref:L-tyrosine/L-tryptophan isonitrile synthase family protein n=1 Tax=Paraburkholderia aspalathi TaxID=1324617 RepID=UPI0038B8287E